MKFKITVLVAALFVLSGFGLHPTEISNDGEVARGIFTTDISDREPVDSLESIPADADRIYFFTELRNFEGKTVKHRWVYDGNTEFEMSFNVGAARWRTWSSKTIMENQTGTWTVEVVSGDRVVQSFEISR